MKTVSLVLLMVAMATGLAHVPAGNHTVNKRGKRELLVRTKRRWVLSTIEIVEEDPGPYPKEATQMFNDRKEQPDDPHHFRISGHGVTQEPLGVFSINQLTGVVLVHKPIDRETYPDFHIRFDILDSITHKPVDRTLSFDVDIKDINDNAPVFDQPVINAEVKENSPEGPLEVSLTARDMDEPDSENSTISMRVVSQTPATPPIAVVTVQGTKLNQLIFTGCFDYDRAPQYKVIVEARDHGTPSLSSSATITLDVIDSNTHLPVFKEQAYTGEVMEMESGKEVVRLGVTDADTPDTPAWRAKYFFVTGNEEGSYKIETDPVTNEGILTVIKGKDFERTAFMGLVIGVENEEPLFVCGAGGPAKKAALPNVVNITVKVIDVNDPPEFEKTMLKLYEREEDEPGKVIYVPKVTDEDSDVNNIRFELEEDPAGWFTIDKKTGKVTLSKKMDRESPHVDEESIYTIKVVAIDDGEPPATATSTVLISLADINDNMPRLVHKSLLLCGNKASRIAVPADDYDSPPFKGPFTFFLGEDDKTLSTRWKLDPATGMEAGLISLKSLAYGNYTVPLVIQDQQGLMGADRLDVVVCDCGEEDDCRGPLPSTARLGSAAIGLLLTGLLLLLLPLCCCFLCRCGGKSFQQIVYQEDEGNQTLIKYNEEGGGSPCAAEPARILNTGTMVMKDVKQSSSAPLGVLPAQTHTQEVDGMYAMTQTSTQEASAAYRSSMRTMMTNQVSSSAGVQSGGFQRMEEAYGTLGNQGGRSQYATWNASGMNGTNRNSMKYPRSFGLLSDLNIADHIDRRLYMIGGDQADGPAYPPHEYAYEGRGSRCHSLDELSLIAVGDDLDFLGDLGPKFKTLGGICEEAMQGKNGGL